MFTSKDLAEKISIHINAAKSDLFKLERSNLVICVDQSGTKLYGINKKDELLEEVISELKEVKDKMGMINQTDALLILIDKDLKRIMRLENGNDKN